MSEQRIEQWWVSVKGELQGIYSVRKAAVDAASAFDAATIVHLVEIREGEEIVGPGLSASAFVLDDMRRERDAAIERAEKAEAALNDLRESYLMESISVDLGARAQFERETAARLLASVRYSYGQGPWSMNVDEAVEEARKLADACFGAKEAKG